MSFQKFIALISLLSLFVLPGCGPDESDKPPAADLSNSEASPAASITPGCRSCHPYELGKNHSKQTCISCHNGNNLTGDPNLAHVNLIIRPAAPSNMLDKCGGCHRQTATVERSLHFTLKEEVNQVRRHFGADHDLETLVDIPVVERPATPLELADDLLRRRCLRCHVYYEGDEYAKVRHGTGCAACHLKYEDGKLSSHEFIILPTDDRCLSCHYSNRVGSDYYGRFDHDFKQEYRTPYRPEGLYPSRPYGIEQHNLSPDIHQSAGMTCIDCHFDMHGGNTMQTISCAACHLNRSKIPPAQHLKAESGELFIVTRQKGIKLKVPRATNPVHERYKDKAACTVCHAQWSYNDTKIDLIRIDHDEYDEWDELFVQDSSEVEYILLNTIYGDDTMAPVMTDKITGREKAGLWLKGYKIRRWADPIIDFGDDGRLQVVRPVLDLHLSWVDNEGETVFDSAEGDTEVLRPYTPHTIGRAGAFYYRRITKLSPENLSAASLKK